MTLNILNNTTDTYTRIIKFFSPEIQVEPDSHDNNMPCKPFPKI